MSQPESIRYLRRAEIDAEKWNQCIDAAPNGLVYAYSFYLDRMAGEWDALVLGDYTAVMPLPWRKKWGLYYIYQPFATAQLGVFGDELTAELMARFVEAVPKHFRLFECSLNHNNLSLPSSPDYIVDRRMNYVLDLSTDYEKLHADYREQTKRNIRKSYKYGCTVRRAIPVYEVAQIAMEQLQNVHPYDVHRFEALYEELKGKEQAITYGVVSQKDELLASCVFFFSHDRAYYLLVGNHPNGRTLGASHALIDAFIRDHAGHNLILDFEGSDLVNLAYFYSSFGAQPEPYPALRFYRLPWWARLFKRQP